jgi:malonate transporter and related proteins
MHAVLTISAPLFLIILAGVVCALAGLMDAAVTGALNRFVYYIALPALLFRGVAEADPAAAFNPGFIGAFGGGIAVAFVLAVAFHKLTAPRLADAGIQALGASFANAGFMGLPLAAIAFGEAGLPPAIVATVLTACALFAVAVAVVETDLQSVARPLETIRRVAGVLIRNPLLVAPVLGGLAAASETPLPLGLHTATTILGAAAGPCALFTLGLFVAQQRTLGRLTTIAWLVFLKLLVQPAATYVLAFHVFPLPAVWAKVAVLSSALPTGIGPFVLAKIYGLQGPEAAGTILVSTALSIVTISALVVWLVR